ncbi:hypothetical protein SUGI_0332490 [Cryptomeria japonica]|nr:hypothetical protein SUGI_0332490 [Cryptomeria japonica]
MGIFSLNHPIVLALGLLGNIISIMVFLAPLPTFIRVYRKKSTEGFQAIPYVVALFSAMFWMYYGVMKPDCTLIVTINSAGCIIETLYLSIYVAYAPKQTKILIAKLLIFLNMGVFGSVVLFTLLFSKGKRRIVIVGWISSAISVTVYAAPLSILRLVICTKSVEFMPFYLSFFLTVNATIWFAYGLLIRDMFVALPNVLGFLFGVVQMAVYILYRNSKEVKDDKATDLAGINGKMNPISLAEIHPIDIPPCKHNGDENSGNPVQMSVCEVDRKQSELTAV